MSTPTSLSTSKTTPRIGGTSNPSMPSITRSVPQSHAPNANPKINAKSLAKGTPSISQTPAIGPLNAHTPTPSGGLPPGSSPAMNLDANHRNRLSAFGNKSIAGSPAPGTPAAFSGLGLISTPLAGANGQLLLGDSLGGQDTEALEAAKTKEINDLLNSSWGTVNQDNIKRCVDRIGGLESYWEDHPGGKERIAERRRTLAIAGNEMMLEIGWLGERVTRATLNFVRGDDAIADDIGAAILYQDLKNEKNAYVGVQDFVENLSRLARIDQLGRGKVSCFEALDGIGKSLKQLWDLEVGKEDGAEKKSIAQLKTMCEKSGRPRTHSNQKIGLRLDYWLDQREFAAQTTKETEKHDDKEHIYSLLIDCEAYNASQYPSIRTSQSWLSSSVADAVSDPTLPIWDDPLLTFIPGTQIENGPDALALGLGTTSGTQPDIRFVARLQPAITLPLFAASEIFAHMEQPLTQSVFESTYLALIFPSVVGLQDGTKDSKVSFQRTAVSYNKTQTRLETRQQFGLFVEPGFWARTITEMPFSHPKQIVEILPYLRQWAFFSRFLRRSFGEAVVSNGLQSGVSSKTQVAHSAKKAKPLNGYRRKYEHYEPPSDTDSSDDSEDEDPTRLQQVQIQVASSKKSKTLNSPNDRFPADVVIETSFEYVAIPRRIDFSVSMDFKDTEDTSACSFDMQIQPNAVVEIGSGIAAHGPMFDPLLNDEQTMERFKKKLERVLRLTEDLGAAASWIQIYSKTL